MSLKDRFRRKSGPKEVGRSKGGSNLLQYGDSEPAKPRAGFLEESTLQNVENRERIYSEIFGESDSVYHELLPLVPHIDVYRFPPRGKRDFFTLVTGGMSDLPMNSPPELGGDYRRIELIFYAAEDRQGYAELLRRLAHFAHDNKTWLHWGHTMPNGSPPTPLFADGPLDALFFMPSIVSPDLSLGKRLSLVRGGESRLVRSHHLGGMSAQAGLWSGRPV